MDFALFPSQPIDFDELIPVFPLPNAVLLPRAILPLHIFEPRYKEMTRDALAAGRLIATALLKPGYEPKYHTLDAELHPIVCVGHVLREERLPEGKYNFLLQGVARALILEEDKERPYRRARLRPLLPDSLESEAQQGVRCELHRLMNGPAMAEVAAQANCLVFLKCRDLCLSDVLDLLASAVLGTVEQKQEFLSEPLLMARAEYLRRALQSLSVDCLERAHCRNWDQRAWPPQCSAN